MEVLISNRQKIIKLNTRQIKKIATAMMEYVKLPDNSELSIVLCDDDFIQKLNYQHLGKNRPTDVLAFPMENTNTNVGEHLIGDIIISIETAQRQAPTANNSLSLEIIFLLIHGFLHLCNYNHLTATERKIMKQKELEIFKFLSEKKLIKELEIKAKDKSKENTSSKTTKNKDQDNCNKIKIKNVRTKRIKATQN